MAGMPLSINSTSAADPMSNAYGAAGNFSASPVYNKPLVDLSNPVHLAAIAGVLLVVVWMRRKK